MSTNIFITGLRELRRRAQEAMEAARLQYLQQLAVKKAAEDLLPPPAQTVNEILEQRVPDIRSLLRNPQPTARRFPAATTVTTVMPIGACFLQTIEYFYNTDGSTYTTPVRGLTRKAMKLRVVASDNASANVQVDVYDHLHFNPTRSDDGTWTEITGDIYGDDEELGGANAVGHYSVFNESRTATGGFSYIAVPIGENSCVLCVGTRTLTFNESSEVRFSFNNGPEYAVSDGTQYDRDEINTLESYTNAGSQSYAYYAWVVTPTSVTATTLPTGVENTLKAELGDGVLTRTFVGYDFASLTGANGFPQKVDTRSGWTSTSEYTSGVYFPGALLYFRENWTWAGTTQYPIYRSDYAGLTQLGFFPDEYPSQPLLWTSTPGTYVALEEGPAARTWLTGDDRTPAQVVSEYLTGAPTPTLSFVADYSAAIASDIAPVSWQRLARLDYKIANVGGGELTGSGSKPLTNPPAWADLPTGYGISSAGTIKVAYWDWGQPTYCQTRASELGFTLP